MKQLLKKFTFELLHAFNFSCTWNKEASSCRYHIVTFIYGQFIRFFIRYSRND